MPAKKTILSIFLGIIYFVFAHLPLILHLEVHLLILIVLFLMLGALTAPLMQKADGKIVAFTYLIVSLFLYSLAWQNVTFTQIPSAGGIGYAFLIGFFIVTVLATMIMIMGAALMLSIISKAKKH